MSLDHRMTEYQLEVVVVLILACDILDIIIISNVCYLIF